MFQYGSFHLINKNIAHNWEHHTKHISIIIIKLKLTDSIEAEYTYNFFDGSERERERSYIIDGLHKNFINVFLKYRLYAQIFVVTEI